MTAMGLFAYGLNRDRGELAQGAVDFRLLRRVLLPLKVFCVVWSGSVRFWAKG